MKKETYAIKLAKLLGIEDKVDTSQYSDKPLHKRKRFVGVPEEDIQSNREGQGILYFLQAPELFQPRICQRKSCQNPYLVSRHQVSYCSYDCIRNELADLGIKWNRSGDLELMAKEVYEGNEPLWIRNVDKLRKVIEGVQSSDDSQRDDDSETKAETT